MNTRSKKILVTGGCGYIGSVLIKKLLKKNYFVAAVDTQWFGNYLEKNDKLEVIKGDIRNLENISFKDVQTVIHLAGIAND